jgi:hypothetical protein
MYLMMMKNVVRVKIWKNPHQVGTDDAYGRCAAGSIDENTISLKINRQKTNLNRSVFLDNSIRVNNIIVILNKYSRILTVISPVQGPLFPPLKDC